MRNTLLMVWYGTLTLSFLTTGCKDTPPAPPPPPYVSTVQLTLEQTGVTELWLKLRFTDSAYPRAFSLQRNATTVFSGTLVGQDTVLLDTNASPKTTHTYKAFRRSGPVPIDSSAPVVGHR